MAELLPARAILQPVLALVLWTLVMWVWLYATRIPAIRRLRVPLTPTQPATALRKGATVLNPSPPSTSDQADWRTLAGLWR